MSLLLAALPVALGVVPGALLAALAVKASVVMLLALGVAPFLRRAPAAARHALWAGALTSVLLLPVLTLVLPAWTVTWPPGWHVSAPAGAAAAPSAAGGVGEKPAPGPVGPSAPIKLEAPAGPGRPFLQRWADALWLLGTGLMLVPLLAGWVQAEGLTRRARWLATPAWDVLLGEVTRELRPCGAWLLAVPGNIMPFTWGVWRPVVIFPEAAADWSDDRRRAVLRHELGHVARLDWFMQTLGALACALYWFNPLVWLVARQMHLEREQACDDLVLGSGQSPQVYARALLDLATMAEPRGSMGFAAVPMARPATIETRLRAILDPKRNRAGLSRLFQLSGLAMAAAVIVPLAMLRAAPSVVVASLGTAAKPPASDPAPIPVPAANQPAPGLHFATGSAADGAWARLVARQDAPDFVSQDLQPPLALYVVDGPGGLATAHSAGLAYPVLSFGTQIDVVLLQDDETGKPVRAPVWFGPNEDNLTSALGKLAALDPVRQGSFEARLVTVEGRNGGPLTALWLKSAPGGTDFIATLAPFPWPGKAPGRLYSAAGFFDAATLPAPRPPPPAAPPSLAPPAPRGNSANADPGVIVTAASASRWAAAAAAVGDPATTLVRLAVVSASLQQAATTLGGATRSTHGGFVELGLDDIAQARAAALAAMALVRDHPAVASQPDDEDLNSPILRRLTAERLPAGNPQPNMYHTLPLLKSALETLQTVPGGELGGAREKINALVALANEDILAGIICGDHANQARRGANRGNAASVAANRGGATAAGPVATSPPTPGQPYTAPLAGEAALDLVWIAPGSFMMGDPPFPEEDPDDRETQIKVTLTQGFWLGKYVVTQSQYEALMGSNIEQVRRQLVGAKAAASGDYPLHGVGPDLPVYYLDRETALQFCRKLTLQERTAGRLPAGFAYTLPTEAQWEYACRAGTTTCYPTGDEVKSLESIAWFTSSNLRLDAPTPATEMHPVGQKQPNAWGLYDMLGNASQWCADSPSKDAQEYPGGEFNDYFRDDSFYPWYVPRGGSVLEGPASPGNHRGVNPEMETGWGATSFRVALTKVPRPDTVQTAPRPPTPIAFADAPPPSTASQRLLALQAALQTALEALKPAPTDPADGFVQKAAGEVRQSLDDATAALAYVHAHPEADRLPADAVRPAGPDLDGLPWINNNFGEFGDQDEITARVKAAYPTLAVAMRAMFAGFRSFLIGGPPVPASTDEARRVFSGSAAGDGPVIGDLGGCRDQIMQHLGRALLVVNAGVNAFARPPGAGPPGAGEESTPPAQVSDPRPGSISGVVLDGDGDPVANALISLDSAAGDAGAYGHNLVQRGGGGVPVTLSDAHGAFTIPNLPPGTYVVNGVLGGTHGATESRWRISGVVGVNGGDRVFIAPGSGSPDPGSPDNSSADKPVEVKAGAETKLTQPLRLGPEEGFAGG